MGNGQTSLTSDLLENEEGFITENHTLMNVIVLDKVIGHLTYPDMMIFRLVCRRWNEVSEIAFWKLSRIVPDTIHIPRFAKVQEYNEKLITSFESTFSQGIPTNAIGFQGFLSSHVLDYILKRRGGLKFTNIYFRRFFSNSTTCIDLNHYLSSIVTTLIVKNLDGNKLMISLNCLANIQNLHLENCGIILNGKISPKELNLQDSNTLSYNGVVFHLKEYYGRNQQKILINQFVDLSKIRKLCLKGRILSLDVGSGSIQLDNLEIWNVELIGLNSSQWTSNRHCFNGNICIGDRMKINSIVIEHRIRRHQSLKIDLINLPISLKKLSVVDFENIVSPHIFTYPHLKSLRLTTTENNFRNLDFTNCTSLANFHLSIYDGIYTMDLSQMKFPNCIKHMRLQNVEITDNNALCTWELDTLVLDHYSLSSAINVLRYINTVQLTLKFDPSLKRGKDKIYILNFWKMSTIQQFAFGEIKISRSVRNSLDDFTFSKCVDNKIGRGYFLFTKTNFQMKSIDVDQFNSLMTIQQFD